MSEADGKIGPGDYIDAYLLEAVVASGTTSTTFRARDTRLGRAVTMKVLHGEMFAGNPGAREKAIADATLAASLEHPNIVPVYGAGEVGDGLWIASRVAEGDTLADAVLSPRRTLELLERVAEAIDAAHVSGAIHREIRPECIVLDRWGNPLVRDYGATKMSGRTGMATRMELLDTLRYNAPEVILGREPTAAIDVYGLAATAVWCLTGTHPFPDLPISQLVELRTQAPPPALDAPDVDVRALNGAVAEGMALEPDARPANAADFVALLSRAVARLPADVAEAPTPFKIAKPGEVVAAAPPPPAPAVVGVPAGGTGLPPPLAAIAPVSDPLPAPVAQVAPRSTTSAPAAPAGATRFDRRREHEPEPEAVKPPTPWLTIVLCVTTVLALAVGAIGIGAMTAAEPSDPPRTGKIELVPGTVWTRAPVGQAPQLQFEDPAVLMLRPAAESAADPSPAPALASVGLVAQPGPPGNPLAGEPLDSFAREPAPSLVRVGRRTIVRYRGRLNEGGVVTVFVLPTSSGGALAVACSEPAAAARCAALLATARLGAVRAVAPQPPEGVVRTVAQAIRDLEQARGVAGLKLAPAERPKQGEEAQESNAAQTLNQLAGAYEQAATALNVEDGDPGTRAQLARVSDVVLNAGDAYERLSTAIDTEDLTLYLTARRAALVADRTLAKALTRLRRAGYSVRLR